MTTNKLRCCVCRKPFFAKRNDARTCSSRCRKRAQRLNGTTVPDIIPPKPLSVKPIGIGRANEFVKQYHRHNGTVSFGQRYAISVVDAPGEIQGVAIVSHPSTRALNGNGYIGEVRRVCTRPGAPSGCCSMLYAAAWRTWKAMGGTRMITYVLERELGTSLKASGWQKVAFSKAHKYGSWDKHPRKSKAPDVVKENKWRWEVSI